MYTSREEKMVIIIKMKGDASILNDFRRHLVKSKNESEPKAYYNITESTSTADKSFYSQMEQGVIYRCAFADYSNEEIIRLYWAKCEKYNENRFNSIHCRLLYVTENKEIINNFKYNLQLDLDNDFSDDSFLNYEISVSLLCQMRRYESDPYQRSASSIDYPEIREEHDLDPLAQKNQFCRRKYNLKSPKNRGEFQRDYDRIIYSKAYRRMVDKAQIFSSIKGDHYRTRMTHTLIVCQISRSICYILKLNSALAEAIAAGHDLGHTPFGHQGERSLHAILSGEPGYEVNNLAVKVGDEKPNYPYGGFKHNYQSVRVATSFESQYLEIDGLDLTEQTLNGMWMHTGKKAGMKIEQFSDGYLAEDGDCAFTMEGQVVAIADEIAQRCHDIDDAFASHLITLSDFSEYLELKKSASLKTKIDGISSIIEELKGNNRFFINETETIRAQISTLIVSYFIQDVCEATRLKMNSYSVDRFVSDGYKVQAKLVNFSDEGESLCKYLDNLIRKKVINSHEVTMFDQNGSNVVLSLFRAYYDNPMLLHDGTLKRIWSEYWRNKLEVVDFKEGKPEIVKDEWKKITTLPISVDSTKHSPDQKDTLMKRKILVRNICDFISGMTDSYAMNEYHRIIQ